MSGKIIYQPSGKAREYCKWAANLYNGCSNKCEYCYNRHSQAKNVLGKDEPELKKSLVRPAHALAIFQKELDTYKDKILDDGGELFFNFVSDPFLPSTIKLNFRCILEASDVGITPRVLTKCVDKVAIASLAKNKELGNMRGGIIFGCTLTGHDELEPGAASNADRIEQLIYANSLGIRTWASIEPIIDPASSLEMIRAVAGVCEEVRVGINSLKKDYTPSDIRYFMGDVIGIQSQNPQLNVIWKKSVLDYIKKCDGIKKGGKE